MRVYCGLASAGERLTAAVVDDGGRVAAVQQLADTAEGYAELLTLLAERADPAGLLAVPVASDAPGRPVPQLVVASGRTACFVDGAAVERLAAAEPPDAADDARRAVAMARALYGGNLVALPQPAAPELHALRPALCSHAALATSRVAAVAALREVLRELYPAALRAFPDPGGATPLALLDALPDPTQVTRGQDENVVARLATAGYSDAADALAALRQAVADTDPPRYAVESVGAAVRQTVAAVVACDTAAGALIREVSERIGTARPEAPEVAEAATGEWATVDSPTTDLPMDPFRPPSGEPTWTPPANGSGGPAPLQSRGRGPKLPSRPARPVMAPTPEAPAAEESTLHLRPKPKTKKPRPTAEPAALNEPLAPQFQPAESPLVTSSAGMPSAAGDTDLTVERPTLPGEPEPPKLDFPTDFQPTLITGDSTAVEEEQQPPQLRSVNDDGDTASVTTLPEPAARSRRGGESGPRSRRRVRTHDTPRRSDSLLTGEPPVGEGDSELLIFAAARSAWFAGEHSDIEWDSLADEGWKAAEAASTPAVGQDTESGLPRRVPQANLVPGSPLEEAEPAPISRDASHLAAQTAGYFRGWQRGRRTTGHDSVDATSSAAFTPAARP
ncbi:MAG TPA: transposase [Actinocatenispora sp.]